MHNETPYIIGSKKVQTPRENIKKQRRRRVYVINIKRIILFSIAIVLLISAPVGVYVYKRLTKNVLPSKSYYFLQIYSETDGVKATADATLLKQKGGAGHIYNDGVFRIMAGVYDNYDDAFSVYSRYAESYTDSMVYELKVPRLDLGKFMESDLCSAVLPIFKLTETEVFSSLQSLDYSLDKGEISQAAVLSAVSQIKEKVIGSRRTIENLKSEYPLNSALDIVIDYLVNICAIIDSNLPIENYSIEYRIKLSLCQLCTLYYDTVNLFHKM